MSERFEDERDETLEDDAGERDEPGLDEMDRAPQPGNTPAPGEGPLESNWPPGEPHRS
jgi:hypothetical protein